MILLTSLQIIALINEQQNGKGFPLVHVPATLVNLQFKQSKYAVSSQNVMTKIQHRYIQT